MTDLEAFQSVRPSLFALAYRMLGDVQRAEDIVQDAWLRWHARDVPVVNTKAYLLTAVARLCLNDLDSARARKEELRGDRLPEPFSSGEEGLRRVEALDQISMAFLVLLQRLSPAERAVLLLHDVFDFEHADIASLVQKNEAACRQLLNRARRHVLTERRALLVSKEIHERLLRAFVTAAASGKLDEVAKLLTDDVLLIADAGADGGRYGGVRNLQGPLLGAKKVAAFIAAVGPRGVAGVELREYELNGQPAMVLLRDGRPSTAILLSVRDEKIRGIFMQADPKRLRRLAAP